MDKKVELKPGPRRVKPSGQQEIFAEKLTPKEGFSQGSLISNQGENPPKFLAKTVKPSLERISKDLYIMPFQKVNRELLWHIFWKRKNLQTLDTVVPEFKKSQNITAKKNKKIQENDWLQPKLFKQYLTLPSSRFKEPKAFFSKIEQEGYNTNGALKSFLACKTHLPATISTAELKRFFNVKIKKPQFNSLHEGMYLIFKNLNLNKLNLNFQHPYFMFLNFYKFENQNRIVKVKCFFRLVFWYLIKIDKNFLTCFQVFKEILLKKVEQFHLLDETKRIQTTNNILSENHFKLLFVVFFFDCTIHNFLTKKLYDGSAKLDIPLAFVFRKIGFFVNFTENDIANIFREVLFKEKNFLLRTQLKKELKKTQISINRKAKIKTQLALIESKISDKETSPRVASNIRSRFSNYSLMFLLYQHHYKLEGNFFDEVLFSLKLSFLYLSLQRSYYYPLLKLFDTLSTEFKTNKDFKEARKKGIVDENLRKIPVLGSDGSFTKLQNLNELFTYLTDPNSGFELWKKREPDFFRLVSEKIDLKLSPLFVHDLDQFNKNLKQSSGSETCNVICLAFLNFDDWLDEKNATDVLTLLKVFSSRFKPQSLNEVVLDARSQGRWDDFSKNFKKTLNDVILGYQGDLTNSTTMVELLNQLSFDLAISQSGMEQTFVFFALVCEENFEEQKLAFTRKYWANIEKSQNLNQYFFLQAYLFGEKFFWLVMLLMYFNIHNKANQSESRIKGFKSLYNKTKYF